MRRRTLVRILLFSTALSLAQLAILVILLHALAPLPLRALVLAAGLWLLGEALWLRLSPSPLSTASPAALPTPPLLSAFFVRCSIHLGWAVVLSLLLYSVRLLGSGQVVVLPWLGLSIGPLRYEAYQPPLYY
ncbi:MAG TPA: hypothetical protein PKW11_10905, partial [Pseudomonadota bacterium]|nr:hypothetical protein [Pseudomonadota bacterium]